MSEFNRLVVAVDFSAVSVGAFKSALELAKKLGAELTVVHAVKVHASEMQLEGGLAGVEGISDKQLEDTDRELTDFVRQHGDGSVEIKTQLCSGEPAVMINQLAQEIKADMIIMGTHGRTGLRHLLLGSVAESVLKNSPVPVLCVRG